MTCGCFTCLVSHTAASNGGEVKAAILCIGTELTRGELVNGNAAWLSEQLTLMGFDVVEHGVLPDDLSLLSEWLKRQASRFSVLVCTGGLGPTGDDLTAEAAALALGVPLREDPKVVAHIERLWAARGRAMPDSNRKQGARPEGAALLHNQKGTAPGFHMRLDSCDCFFLPGVPFEMRDMFRGRVAPQIRPLVEATAYQVHLRTFGMTESGVAERLSALESAHPEVTVAYRASFPEIELKVLARGASAGESKRSASAVANQIRELLGDVVYGNLHDTFAGAVGRALRTREHTIAVAESCTGGLASSMLTSVPGSSDYFLLGAVTYANESKARLLGVSDELLRAHGAVSAEVVSAMADGVRRAAQSDLAISISGVAGPGGGTEEKPVGTVWFGVSERDRPTYTGKQWFPGERKRVQVLSAYWALRLAWLRAKNLNLP